MSCNAIDFKRSFESTGFTMRLRLLLWFLARVYQRSAQKNKDMQAFLEDVSHTIQFTTSEQEVHRYLRFTETKIESDRTLTEADMTIEFDTPMTGYRVLMAMASGKDKNAFMRGIQDQQIKVHGDSMLLLWFQQSVKFVR